MKPENRSAEELLHELQIHQVELEMQNEELRCAHAALEESHDRYVDLYDFAPVGYLTLTREGMIAEINLTAAELLGLNRRKLLNRRFAAFVSRLHGDRWHLFFAEVMKHNERKNTELTLKRSDNTEFPVQLDCRCKMPADQNSMLRITLTDMTESSQLKALKISEHQLRIAATAFETQEGIMITDADKTILRVNKAFTDITGYSEEEVIGKNPRILKSGRQNTDFYTAMWDSISSTGAWKGEIWNQGKDGRIYPEHLAITAVNDSNGMVTNYVATFADITMSKIAADEIKHLAFYDPLTNLPNRQLLRDRLALALISSHRSGQKGALLYIDLDNFKTLNDTLGHNIGDLLLQQVADRLTFCVREGDTVARLGGDEFVVMLEDLNEQDLEAAAQTKVIGNKILHALNKPYRLATHDYHCTPSIGATLFNGHQQAIDELLKQADIAMYQAKATGRNGIRFFDQQMQTNISVRVALEKDLRRAVEENQFKLYYQPQVHHNRQIIGAEVLLRWEHPQQGLVSPADFIPLAEETGLILPIGQWVLETACAQIKTWENSVHARHLLLAVNVSACQFYKADFVTEVSQMLDRSAIKPDRLKLELTESLVLDDIDEVINKMHLLREIGVRFSMDDFGTGYSSLSYLTQLPLNQLKIDQSFVRNIGVKPTDAVIVQTIIGMSKNLGIDVIAEGVETEEQRAFLELHGCPTAQGYLFGRPLPLADFEYSLGI